MLRRQLGGLLPYSGADRVRQPGYDDVGRRHCDPAVRGDAVVRDAAMPLAWVGLGHPQTRHRTTAEDTRGVDRLARGDSGESPSGAGAEVARALDDDGQVRVEDPPG